MVRYGSHCSPGSICPLPQVPLEDEDTEEAFPPIFTMRTASAKASLRAGSVGFPFVGRGVGSCSTLIAEEEACISVSRTQRGEAELLG